MRPLLLAPTVLALGGLPAMAQTPTGDGSFYALPAGADTATLLSVMSRNADIARPESGGTMAMTLAPGDLTPGTGGSVTDAAGNVFTLPFKGGMWGNSMGQPMENGSPITDGTGWVAAIRIVNGTACFDNAKGLGWGCQGSGTWVADPGGASASATTPRTAPATIGATSTPPGAPSATPQPGPNVQACAVPDPAALVGYNTPVVNGPINLNGGVWKAIPGANITQGANGSITIAGGGSTYNNQVGTVHTISGGFYARATLSWTGTAQWLPGNGWPAFWGTNTAAGLGMNNVEADFLEAMSGATAVNGGLHNWNPDGSDTASGGNNGGVNAVPSGTDFFKPNTFGFLSLPATATAQGHAIWYFNGQQVQDIPITAGGIYSTLATEPLTIMVGSGTANPMTIYDVEVWQASASGVAGNGPMAAAAVYCPGNDGSIPPTTTTSVTPPATINNTALTGHQGTLVTTQANPTQTATGAGDSPAAQTPSFDTTALDAAAAAQADATRAAIAAADAQTPANAALVRQAVTAGQQADSILAGVLAAVQGGGK